MNLAIWKPKSPALKKDSMPDVHEATARALQERKVRIEHQFKVMTKNISELTEIAIRRGKLAASDREHHSDFFPETLRAVEKWLSEKGYRVERTNHGSCRCGAHFNWSWQHKAAQYGEAPVVMGVVEREPQTRSYTAVPMGHL